MGRTRDPDVSPTDYLPRQWYGQYVRESLVTTAHDAADSAELAVVFDEVRRVARHPAGGWMVHLGRGPSLRSDAVVLAIGHRPPSDPIGLQWRGPRTRFIADPWRPFAMNVVGSDESVLILGTGLTAVDAVLSLTQQAVELRSPWSREMVSCPRLTHPRSAARRFTCPGRRAGRSSRWRPPRDAAGPAQAQSA